MKKCPKCELNYIEDYEDNCEICEQSKKNWTQSNIRGVVVKKDEIHNPISPNAVYQIVRYLIGDYGQEDRNLYDTENPFSYRSILNKLKITMPYAIIRYKSGAFKQYLFDGDKVWQDFFLVEPSFNKLILGWKVDSINELYAMALEYHSKPIKRRNV